MDPTDFVLPITFFIGIWLGWVLKSNVIKKGSFKEQLKAKLNR